MGFIENHLGKILVVNGLADMSFAVIPVMNGELAGHFAPLASSLGAESPAFLALVRTAAHMFAFHGAVRVLAGVNMSNKIARYMAIVSYLAEVAFAAPLVLSGDASYDTAKLSVMAIAPMLVVPFLAMYKDDKGKQD